MNCRETEQHIFAERDGALDSSRHTALAEHVAACPACRRKRDNLAGAIDAWRISARGAAVPNATREWAELRRNMREVAAPKRRRRRNAIAWFGAPVVAAAAVAFAVLVNSPSTLPREIARAEFVEVPAENVSTVVFVDDQSGWLVVWASDAGANPG